MEADQTLDDIRNSIIGNAATAVGHYGFEFATDGLDEIEIARLEQWKWPGRFAYYTFHEAKKAVATRHKEDLNVDERTRKACLT